MKSAFLILAGGILFTGVFLSRAICGGWLVYDVEKVTKENGKKPEVVRYTDIHPIGSDIFKENKE